MIIVIEFDAKEHNHLKTLYVSRKTPNPECISQIVSLNVQHKSRFSLVPSAIFFLQFITIFLSIQLFIVKIINKTHLVFRSPKVLNLRTTVQLL